MDNKQKLDIALSAVGLPKSKDFKETKEHIEITWDGNQTMNAGVIIAVLESSDINYSDRFQFVNPIVHFKLEPATNTTVRTVMNMKRMMIKSLIIRG